MAGEPEPVGLAQAPRPRRPVRDQPRHLGGALRRRQRLCLAPAPRRRGDPGARRGVLRPARRLPGGQLSAESGRLRACPVLEAGLRAVRQAAPVSRAGPQAHNHRHRHRRVAARPGARNFAVAALRRGRTPGADGPGALRCRRHLPRARPPGGRGDLRARGRRRGRAWRLRGGKLGALSAGQPPYSAFARGRRSSTPRPGTSEAEGPPRAQCGRAWTTTPTMVSSPSALHASRRWKPSTST